MPHDPEKYLDDVLDSCEFLIRHIAGRSLEDCRRDRAFRFAAERELQIIGEAVFQLSRTAPEVALRVKEHRRIMPFGTCSFTGTIRLTRRSSGSCFEKRFPSWRSRCAT